MKNQIFTVPQVPGSKRTSARIYTHAIIGCRNWATELTAEREKINKHYYTDQFNWRPKRMKAFAAAQPGETVDNHILTEDQISEAAEWLVTHKYSSLDEFVSTMWESHVAEIKAKIALGDVYDVLQWSMSEKNALKAINSFAWGYTKLKVVPVEIMEPAKKLPVS